MLLLLRQYKIGQQLLCGQAETKTMNSGSGPTGDSLSINKIEVGSNFGHQDFAQLYTFTLSLAEPAEITEFF